MSGHAFGPLPASVSFDPILGAAICDDAYPSFEAKPNGNVPGSASVRFIIVPPGLALYRRSRLISGAMAFIFTVAPLTALYFSATPRFHTAHTEKITYLIIPGTGMPTEQQQPTHVRSRSSNQQQSKQLPSALIPANRSAEPIPLPFETASPIEVPAAVLALPQQTASSPLRIDSEVIRSAIQGTRPQARRMAEGSNAFFGDEPISKSERIAHAVLKAAKPDCFNETSGGTLLSIFVIAYEVARDKCK